MNEENQNNESDTETLKDLEGPHTRVGDETIADVFDAVAERVQNASDFDADNMLFTSNAGDDIPEDYEISVTTYTARGSETVSGVFIWATPTVEAVAKAKPDYLADLNRSKHTSRCTDIARRFIVAGEEGEPSFPTTIREFVTRASSGIAAVYTPAFEAVYPLFKDAIKSLKVYNLSKREVFDAMTNKAYAEFHYQHAESDEVFVKLMNAAIARIDMEPTEAKPALTDKKGIIVSSDWFKAQLEARNTATYNVESDVVTDDVFTF